MPLFKQCCRCAVTPDLIPNISFNGISKVPSDWLDAANCCPHVRWDYLGYGGEGILLSAEIVRNDNACLMRPNPQYYCISARLANIRFWFNKFSCSEDWYVTMAADVDVTMGISGSADCGPPQTAGRVTFYREKFIPSITAPTSITFTASDHYDWTAPGACADAGFCPGIYTGEIETTAYFCCVTILNPNCGTPETSVSPLIVNFLSNDFTFYIT